MRAARWGLLAMMAGNLFGAYTYYRTEVISGGYSFGTAWTLNGSTAYVNGTGIVFGNYGSMISTVAVPDGSAEYEVRTSNYTYGDNVAFVHLLRASSDAMHSETVTQGSYYAVVMKKTGYSTATLAVYKRVSGTVTLLATTNIGIIPGGSQVMRTVIRGNGTILSYVNGVRYHKVTDSSLTTGKPGVGGYGFVPGGWYGVQALQLGPLDRVAPGVVSSTGFAVTALANNVDMQWVPSVDDANGVGVYSHQIYRNSVYIGETPTPQFADAAVSPATSYTHAVEAVDMHGNASAQYSLNITTAPAGSIEPRRVGVRSEGSYWGAAGEQIDMRSGNLNYTLPLLSAKGRGAWGATLALSYNSQNWRKDTATWRFGRDVGYGFGWRLMAGALTPVFSDIWTVHHYVFTDSTGAEYRLGVNSSGVWSSAEGAHVWFVAATNRLYFPDGSFWVMDALSGGTEDDAGTRYPTRMQDTNGNYVDLRYLTGLNAPYANSSARISQVEDVRASTGGSTYTFTYNSDAIPHLTGIANSIGTAESFSFTYTAPALLYAPFAGSGSYGNAQMLQLVTQTGTGLSHTMEYGGNGAGELSKIVFPYQGELRWTYNEFTFTGNRTVREVATRQLVKQSGATPWNYTISHPSGDTAQSAHSATTLDDAGGIGQRYWTFVTSAGFTNGLVATFEKRAVPGPVLKEKETYTWTQDAAGRPYVGTVLSESFHTDSTVKQSKTEQTLDVYGNLTQMKQYDFGNLATAARTYTNTYLTGANYTSRYIFNRLTQAQVTNGTNTVTLASNTYDACCVAWISPSPQQHDSLYYGTGFQYRGNVTVASSPGTWKQMTYDMTGTVQQVSNGYGQTLDVTSSSANDYAVPSAVKPNGNTSLQQSFTWNGFLGLTQESGPNGATAATTYDSNARPSTETSPDGAVTTYVYTNSPPTVKATTNLHWVKTTTDGFGRTIRVERGDNLATKSIVDTEYEPCACSPLGKVKRVSLPYAPGGTVYWATSSYDALGRTVSVALPNGAGTTTYAFVHNTVTVTDPAGKWKKYESDALGNVTKTTEPNPAGGTWDTTFSYSVVNKLVQVQMTRGSVTQTRTWNYDAATQRLTSETHPETGTTSYSYNGDGSLAWRTTGNGKTLGFTYDSLGRVTNILDTAGDPCAKKNILYDDVPSNAMGRPHRVESGWWSCASAPFIFVEEYDYSASGKPTKKSVGTSPDGSDPGNWVDMVYTYNNEGQVTGLTVARRGGSTFGNYTYYYDSMGRPYWMNSGGMTLVSNVNYNAAGQMTSMLHSGLAETRQYNVLGEITRLTVAGQFDLEYRYSASANNGQITSMKNFTTGEEVNYGYDALSRLTSAATTGPEWGLSFVYDGFGNKTAQTISKGSGPSMSIAVDGNNRVVGHTYDGAGNTLTMPGFSGFTWDAHGRMKTAVTSGGQTDSFQYGGDGLRVFKNGQLFVRGTRGELLAVFDHGTMNYVKGYSYFAGRVVGQKEDRLGTVQNGSRFYPYGEESGSTAGDNNKYATYWRDAGTGLDYAMHRYYANALGRFLSPDPAPTGSAKDSQTWNRFAYANGDPVNFNDPRGLYGCPANYQVDATYNGITYRTTYIHLCYETGWVVLADHYYGWGSSFNSSGRSVFYVGGQDIYESGSCTDINTGLPCYQSDLAKRYWGSLATEDCNVMTWIAGDCDDEPPQELRMAISLGMRSRYGLALSAVVVASNRIAGLRFEAEVARTLGLIRNIGSPQFRIAAPSTLSGHARIPDIVNHGMRMIGEIKSSMHSVPFTPQIRDMAMWAQQNGYTFVMYVRQGAGGIQNLRRHGITVTEVP